MRSRDSTDVVGTMRLPNSLLMKAEGQGVPVIVPIVMCGGAGTRLWPLSRRQHPKQFLKLYGEYSPFQEAIRRSRALKRAAAPVVIGSESHRFLILDELAQLGADDVDVLLEPLARNTAPALAMAAVHASRDDASALLLAMPADHFVEDAARFAAAVERGVEAARDGAIVLFGVTPNSPHTGYGYIQCDARGADMSDVVAFKEKPDEKTARAYVDSGKYLWNSGVFLMRADAFLAELDRHAPEISRAARSAVEGAHSNGGAIELDRDALAACPSESVDYAVMEKAECCKVVRLDVGWSDLGTWSSLLAAGSGGNDGRNVARGDVLLTECRGSFVHSSGRLVTAVGLRDQVVVSTPDAVFVAPLDRAHEVKDLVSALEQEGREEVDFNPRVHRPWGWYERLTKDDGMQVKLIQVNPGASLSLQMHHHRSEHWFVVRGTALVTRGDEEFVLKEQESIDIPVRTLHRLTNAGKEPVQIIEVQKGAYLGEDDIVRFDDNYGRAANG